METAHMEIAKWVVAAVAVFGFGGYVADAVVPATARQHQRNPNWPLSLPIFLLAAALAALYFVTMALATIFPGTAWTDPEFAEGAPRPLGLHPQQLVSYIVCAVVAAAVVLAAR